MTPAPPLSTGFASQPDEAQPEEWQQRRDHTTRRLVTGFQQQLGRVEDEVSSLSHGLSALKESSVSHRSLMAWAGGFAISIIGGLWILIVRLESSTEKKLEGAAKAVETAKAEGKADTAELRRDVRDLYRAVLTRRRQERLEQPVEEP